MEKSSNNSRTVVLSDEIAEILNIARKHRWHLTYSAIAGGRRVSQTTELLDINLNNCTLVLGSEMKYTGIRPSETISFRAQSGGISLSFDSQLRLAGKNELSNRLFSECRVEFPEALVYTQLRQAIRFSCENIQNTVVTFFDGEGHHLEGAVADISAGGVKVKMRGNLSAQLRAAKSISDCRLLFPNNTELKLRVNVLGVMYDDRQDMSFARCCFLEMQEDIEVKLGETIAAILDDKGPLKYAQSR